MSPLLVVAFSSSPQFYDNEQSGETLHFWYFFGYKTEFFPVPNNPKNLDPSYKTDLDIWGSLGRVKLVLEQNFMALM